MYTKDKRMMRLNKQSVACITLILLCGSAFSEMRVWREVSGESFVGEYVREKFEKFYFKDTEKQVRTVDASQISPIDLKYIRTMIPPKITVSLKKKSDRVELLPEAITGEMDERIFDITVNISIRKTSPAPFEGVLRGELYLVGQEVATDHHRMLLKNVFPIMFPKDGKPIFEYTAIGRARMYMEYGGEEMRGNEYEGYALFIYGADGKMMELQTDLEVLKDETKIDTFRQLRENWFFKENCKKSSVPRMKVIEYLDY